MTWSVSGLALCLGLALAWAADTASATTINPMGQVSPAGSATTTISNWGRGYEFTVDAADVVVTQLGYVTPGAGSYELALWEVSTGTKIASRQSLGGTASTTGWEFFPVTPVALTQGAAYRVTLYGLGTASYYFSTSLAYQPSGDIDHVGTRFCNSCGPGTMPSLFLGGYNYGYADIGYQFGMPAVVPLPAGLALALAGVGALGTLSALRRRRR